MWNKCDIKYWMKTTTIFFFLILSFIYSPIILIEYKIWNEIMNAIKQKRFGLFQQKRKTYLKHEQSAEKSALNVIFVTVSRWNLQLGLQPFSDMLNPNKTGMQTFNSIWSVYNLKRISRKRCTITTLPNNDNEAD